LIKVEAGKNNENRNIFVLFSRQYFDDVTKWAEPYAVESIILNMRNMNKPPPSLQTQKSVWEISRKIRKTDWERNTLTLNKQNRNSKRVKNENPSRERTKKLKQQILLKNRETKYETFQISFLHLNRWLSVSLGHYDLICHIHHWQKQTRGKKCEGTRMSVCV